MSEYTYYDGQPVRIGDLAGGGRTFGVCRIVDIDDGGLTGVNVKTGERLYILPSDADLIERGGDT